MKRVKFILTFTAIIFLSSVSVKSSAQYLSWYTVTYTHPVYLLAQSWGGADPDYTRGFCFAYDALGGHTVHYNDKTVIVGGNMNPLKFDLGTGIDVFLYTQYLESDNLYNAASQLESDYLPTLTDPSQIKFFQGYINFLYQVSYSPGLIEAGPFDQN